MCLIGIFLLINVALLFHIMIYKCNPGHVKTPRFAPIDKQFSKAQLNSMSSDLKKLLSYSHHTEQDLIKSTDDEQLSKLRRCDNCDDIKPMSMSHWSKCNVCVYKLDHHCPWTNSCVSLHNLNYFLSMLFYVSVFCFFNLVILFEYNDSKHYTEHLYKCRIMILLNWLLFYVTTPYALMEFFINAKGRTFLEIMGECFKGPSKPKYKLETNWRENLYLVYGTWYLSLAVPFPYFYKPPITGLEFWFMSHNKEVEDFISNTFSPVFKLFWHDMNEAK